LLEIRTSNVDDLIPLMVLVKDHYKKFTEDSDPPIWKGIAALIANGEIITLTHNHYPVGLFWFNNFKKDLFVEIHFLVWPKYYREIVKSDIFEKVLTRAFQIFKVRKIKAQPLETQHGICSTLKRYHFLECRRREREAMMNGKILDIRVFELRSKWWNKHLKGKELCHQDKRSLTGNGMEQPAG
jgi:RimJ/RimL family protein N-acetyltransferase